MPTPEHGQLVYVRAVVVQGPLPGRKRPEWLLHLVDERGRTGLMPNDGRPTMPVIVNEEHIVLTNKHLPGINPVIIKGIE